MTIRPALVGLIDSLRRLVDPAGALDIDAELAAEHLDRAATRVLALELTPERHPLTGVTLAHVAPVGAWDDDAATLDAAGAADTATTADPLRGRWEWDTDHPGPVYLDGTTYDLNAAGASLAQVLAPMVARGIISHTDAAGESWSRGDASAALLELARSLRANAPAGSVPLNIGEHRGPFSAPIPMAR